MGLIAISGYKGREVEVQNRRGGGGEAKYVLTGREMVWVWCGVNS